MKLLSYAVALFFLAATAGAQRAEIVVSVNGGDNCITVLGENGFNATSYSLGGTEKMPAKGGPGGPPIRIPPALADLTITKNFDSCSEFLIRMFLAAKMFPSVTLIQYQDNVGQTDHYAALTITLTSAMINNDRSAFGSPEKVPCLQLQQSMRNEYHAEA